MPSVTDLPQNEQDDLMSFDINPMSPLKLKYIGELREKAKDLLDAYEYPEYIVNDINLLRFLRGHMYDMEETVDAFRKMLIWRKEKNVDAYFKKVQEVDFDVHKVPYADLFEPVFSTNYHHHTDREGHLLDIRLLGSIDVSGLLSHTLEEWIDYTIYVLEWRIYTLNKYSKETGKLQRLCCIQDLKGVGMHMVSAKLVTYFKEMTNVTSYNYPETMHRSFVVNVPGIFSSLWSIAKPVMHPRTVKKVVICKGDFQQSLYDEIPIENLPVYLGGICNCPEGCLTAMKNREQFVIPVSSKLTIPVDVKAGNTVEWNWKLESGNIDYTVRMKNGKEVKKGDRISEDNGSMKVEEDGVLEFYFDNSFSWINGKTVVGMIKINP